jgi:hypothetical protein
MAENPKITLPQKIALLRIQIAAAVDLELAELLRWRMRSENALRYTVGPDSPALRRFREVSYDPTLSGMGNSTEERVRAREAAARAGIGEATECLQFAVDELALYAELLALPAEATGEDAPPNSSR